MGGLADEGWRLICLKGNHEDIMWQTCRRKVPDCGWWLDNGGGATLISYGQNEGDHADVTVVLDEHLKWIERLPLMHVDKHRIFVHAGVNPNYPLDEQDPRMSSGKSMMTTMKADTGSDISYTAIISTRTARS